MTGEPIFEGSITVSPNSKLKNQDQTLWYVFGTYMASIWHIFGTYLERIWHKMMTSVYPVYDVLDQSLFGFKSSIKRKD